jgi:hypothetical protein
MGGFFRWLLGLSLASFMRHCFLCGTFWCAASAKERCSRFLNLYLNCPKNPRGGIKNRLFTPNDSSANRSAHECFPLSIYKDVVQMLLWPPIDFFELEASHWRL